MRGAQRRGNLPWPGRKSDIRTGQSWCDPEHTWVRSYKVSVEPGETVVKGPYVAETIPVRVEGDYVVEPAEEARLLLAFRQATRAEEPGAPLRHLDAPASLATQEALLGGAGFSGFHLRWHEGEAAIYSGVAPG